MKLTQQNIDRYCWLFSPSLGYLVREHEGSEGWDYELDEYVNYGTEDEPCWDVRKGGCQDSADTLEELIKNWPELAKVSDWIHGDDVEFA